MLKSFGGFMSFALHSAPPHPPDAETKPQRGRVTCPRSHSLQVTKAGLSPKPLPLTSADLVGCLGPSARSC